MLSNSGILDPNEAEQVTEPFAGRGPAARSPPSLVRSPTNAASKGSGTAAGLVGWSDGSLGSWECFRTLSGGFSGV